MGSPLAAGDSFTKYATLAGSHPEDDWSSPNNVLGAPNGAYSACLLQWEEWIWGGGYATETGTISGVVIKVMYKVDNPAVDDTMTLKYSLDGGTSFGATQLTWVPTDTSWVEKSLDIMSDTSVNGGSWDWTDIGNLRIYIQNTVVGNSDGQIYTFVDALYVTVTTGTSTTTSPPAPPPAAQQFDFSVSVSPASLSVQQSGSVSATVSAKLASGSAQPVLLSGSWVGTAPTGVTPSFSPPSGTPNFSSTLTFSTMLGATTGTFTYKTIGISGGITHTANISLTITKLMSPAAPTLVSPDNGVTIDTNAPTFDWADLAVVTSYTLEVATDDNFSHIIITKTTNESAAAISQAEALSYGTLYYWRARGTNAAGVGDWSPARAFTSKQDAPKVSSFQIASGSKYVNSTEVQLSITALNSAQMSLSSDGITWGEWMTFQSSKSYTLSPPDGIKNIYVRARDAAGDIGQSVMSSLILDQTPPITTHFLSGDLEGDAYKDSVVVSLSVEEVTSGVRETKYRIDNGEWETGSTFVLAKDGRHTIEYYSTDVAGNNEAAKTIEVTVFTPTIIPPIVSQYWWVILPVIVAAGVVSTFVIRKARRAGRLKRIKKEKAQLPKMKREAETKYFKDGSISRDTYDAMVKDYQRRKAELEKEERMLKVKAKPKVKEREAKGKVKKPKKEEKVEQ